MFTTKEEKRVADEISNSSNTIGKGTFLEGNVETYGNIRIEGKITGNVKSKSKIAVWRDTHKGQQQRSRRSIFLLAHNRICIWSLQR